MIKLKELIKEKIKKLQEQKHTFTGNTKFMKKKILPIMRKAGIKHIKVRDYGGGQMEVDFNVNDEIFNFFKDSLKKTLGKQGGYKWKQLNLQLEGLEKELIKESMLKDMTWNRPKPLVRKEERIKEGQISMRSAVYALGDAIENLGWLANRNTNYMKDRQLKAQINKLYKANDTLLKYLDKNYDWD